MTTVLLGIGTNIGERLDNLNTAISSIGKLPGTRCVQVSHVYETAPVGYLEQPPFLNIVLRIETNLSAQALLGACLGIEAAMGRIRQQKDGPRIIDIDILIYDGVKSDTYELTLPHPRMTQRAFVMVPLRDIYPNGIAPMVYFSHKLKDVGEDGVALFGEETDFYVQNAATAE